jgi:hypothetical protein
MKLKVNKNYNEDEDSADSCDDDADDSGDDVIEIKVANNSE